MSKYYVERSPSRLYTLRQGRFYEQRKHGFNHPFDVCAVARDVPEMEDMVKSYFSGDVDWSLAGDYACPACALRFGLVTAQERGEAGNKMACPFCSVESFCYQVFRPVYSPITWR